jgi:hypothetical protein
MTRPADHLEFTLLRERCRPGYCFADRNRVRFDRLNTALRDRCGFTDLDAETECNGFFLLLEWKRNRGDLPTGQRISFERKPPQHCTVVVVGDCATMTTSFIAVIRRGRMSQWFACDFDELRFLVHLWESCALTRARPTYRGRP